MRDLTAMLQTRDCTAHACTQEADGPDGLCGEHRHPKPLPPPALGVWCPTCNLDTIPNLHTGACVWCGTSLEAPVRAPEPAPAPAPEPREETTVERTCELVKLAAKADTTRYELEQAQKALDQAREAHVTACDELREHLDQMAA